MNQKAFAIFVGAIMILSAFASFVLRGSDQNEVVVGTNAWSVETFGVQGRLVDWDFNNLEDALKMSPPSTIMAYWINTTVSQNLTDAARAALPQSLGLTYGSQLYSTNIDRLAEAYFNNTWIEFHWIKPYHVGYSGLVVPYNNYMMIPAASDFVTVMGKPTLFGTQAAMKQAIDVISGGLATDNFTLTKGEYADLQVAALGKADKSPLSGGYKEFYLGVSKGESGFNLTTKILQPDTAASQKAKDMAGKYNLKYSASGSDITVDGSVPAENLQGALVAILGP